MDHLKEYTRMCNAHPGCLGCPIFVRREEYCQKWIGKNLQEAKQIISDWAAANKESVLPSLNDWWRKEHPDVACSRAPCYRYFDPQEKVNSRCSAYSDCEKCLAAPIPLEFAPLMGVEVPVEVTYSGKN